MSDRGRPLTDRERGFPEYDVYDLSEALWLSGQRVSHEASKAIHESETLSEAVTAARNHGLDVEATSDWELIEPILHYETRMGISDLYLDQFLRSAGVTHMGQIREDVDEPPVGVRHYRQGSEPIDVTTEVQSILEDNLTMIEEHAITIQERYDTTVPEEEEEDEPTFSKYLFPDWAPGIDPAYHFENVIGRDDYSPWPYATREDVIQYLGPNREDFFMKDINYSEEDKAYWRNQFAQPGGYLSGEEVLIWSQFTPDKRASVERQMVLADELDAGGFDPGSVGFTQLEAFRKVLAYGNFLGVGWNVALQRMGVEAKFRRDNEPKPPRGPGRVRASFSVPASLRTVPDYESAEQEIKNLLRNRLGRDPEDWELGVLADNILGHYRDANTEKIKAARAAFNQAQRGISGDMEIEVPNPQLRTEAFIEDRYSAEIDRTTQVQDTSVTNRLMLEAITQGARMVS